jgi:NitT/TauT family transport system permease protein
MTEQQNQLRGAIAPVLLAIGALILWAVLCATHLLSPQIFPSPGEVANGFVEIVRKGRLYDDLVASLFRVAIGFVLAVLLGIPIGMWIGRHTQARQALMPFINFFRSLSPIAWLGFAVAWFGLGDKPAIFLIFLSAVFPLAVTAAAAVATIPSVYFRVAGDYSITGWELLTRVMLPAILPQIITSLRVTMGVAWVVVVAAEMVAGSDGLGWAISDDRNALRPDLLVVHMIVIGLVGLLLDRLLSRLTQIPSVRWGYER